jgi:hypothetical protein
MLEIMVLVLVLVIHRQYSLLRCTQVFFVT